MGAAERAFSDIDGTPVHYWRYNHQTAGRQSRHRTFYCTHEFYGRLVSWIRELRILSSRYGGLGPITKVVSAGAYVNKPGQHGRGQAFDLDQVVWTNGQCTPYYQEHGSGDLAVVRRYLAVDAVTRRQFRFTLDGGFNRAHADHIHFDFGGQPVHCDRGSRSDTVFVQRCANVFMGSGLAIDGQWGSRTQAAFDESRRRLGIASDPHRVSRAWQDWCHGTARCGFGNRPFEPPPRPPPGGRDPAGGLLEPFGL